MSTRILLVLKRLAPAIPFAAFCAYSIHRAFGNAEHSIEIIAWLLYAAAMLIAIAAIFALPLAEIIGERISRFYLPGGTEIPPPHYPMAEIYEREAKWDLAFAEYEKILFYHPQELPAHIARIRIATHAYQDPELARSLLRKSLRRLRDPAARQSLQASCETNP